MQQPPPQVIYVQAPQTNRGGCTKWVIGGVAITGGLVAICIVIMLVGALSGERTRVVSRPGASPTAASLGSLNNPALLLDPSGKAGVTLMGDGLAVTLHGAHLQDTAGALAGFEEGYKYVVLDVSLRNESGQSKGYNTLYWSADDPEQGYKYDDVLFGSTGQDLGAGDIAPGNLARGNVILKVREDTDVVRVRYRTLPIGGREFYWLVKVGG